MTCVVVWHQTQKAKIILDKPRYIAYINVVTAVYCWNQGGIIWLTLLSQFRKAQGELIYDL